MANIEYNEQEQIRRDSLSKLRELGIEPYPEETAAPEEIP